MSDDGVPVIPKNPVCPRCHRVYDRVLLSDPPRCPHCKGTLYEYAKTLRPNETAKED